MKPPNLQFFASQVERGLTERYDDSLSRRKTVAHDRRFLLRVLGARSRESYPACLRDFCDSSPAACLFVEFDKPPQLAYSPIKHQE